MDTILCMTGKATRAEIAEGDDPATEPVANAINRPTDLKFNITDCKLYVLVVTLQKNMKKNCMNN